MKSLTLFEKGYMAGMIDFEGSIGLRESKTKYNTYVYSSNIAVTNTSKKLLNHLQTITGIGEIYIHEINHKKRKDSWMWSIRSKDQKDFLIQILPYLKGKIQQALIVLDFLDIPVSNATGSVSNETKITRGVMVREIAELNKRGRDLSKDYSNYYPKEKFFTTKELYEKPSENELGWICAGVDAEGYIGIQSRFKRNFIYNATIQVSNTSITLLESFQTFCKRGIFREIPHHSEKRKPVWIWHLNQSEKLSFLIMIEPHLIVKKLQCQLVIEFLNLPLSKGGKLVPQDIQIKKGGIYLYVKELNKVGKL